MEQFLSWIGLGFTLLINVATIAFTLGNTNARISFLESQLKKIELEQERMKAFHADIEVLKTKIDNLYDCLQGIREALTKEEPK